MSLTELWMVAKIVTCISMIFICFSQLPEWKTR